MPAAFHEPEGVLRDAEVYGVRVMRAARWLFSRVSDAADYYYLVDEVLRDGDSRRGGGIGRGCRLRL